MTTPTRMAAEELLRARPRIPQHAVHRAFPSETVVLDLNTGIYHGLNAVAGKMLLALDESPTVAAALARLAHEVPEAGNRLKDDLCELCEQLAARGLLELLPPARS